MNRARGAALLAALVLLVSCSGHTSNRLVGDPMADVTVAGAERVKREVIDPHGSSPFGKWQQAEVWQVYRASASGRPAGALVAELVRRARMKGWVFRPSHDFGFMADKEIKGAHADLFVGLLEPGSATVNLLLNSD